MTAGTTHTGSTESTERTERTETTELDQAAFLARREQANLAAVQDESKVVTRRKVFAVGSAGALALGLAACGSGDDETSAAAAAAAGATTDAATETDDSDTETTEPDDTETTAAAKKKKKSTATELASLDDVPVGGAVGVKVDDKPYIVAQPTEGKAAVWSAICPHQGCTVAASGTKELACPCHGSKFDVKTGDVTNGPATTGLPKVKSKVTDGKVVLA